MPHSMLSVFRPMALRPRLSTGFALFDCEGVWLRAVQRWLQELPAWCGIILPDEEAAKSGLRAISRSFFSGALTPVRRPGCLRQSSGLLAALVRQTRWLCVPALRLVCPCRGRRRP